LKKEKTATSSSRSRDDATREACSAIRALTTGDDPREPASGAFAHARALAKAGAATALCAALAREAEAGDRVDLRLAQAARRRDEARRRERRHLPRDG
jgi:hypothetical protein